MMFCLSHAGRERAGRVARGPDPVQQRRRAVLAAGLLAICFEWLFFAFVCCVRLWCAMRCDAACRAVAGCRCSMRCVLRIAPALLCVCASETLGSSRAPILFAISGFCAYPRDRVGQQQRGARLFVVVASWRLLFLRHAARADGSCGVSVVDRAGVSCRC
jgi:hypothetical protein